MNKRRRIGLALGGGVARGPAHIGVLTVLEEAGIPVDCVAGASAGAIMGAAYCAGIPVAEMRAIAQDVSWLDLVTPVFPRWGLVSFAKLECWMEETLGVLDVRDLALPFAAVATDLDSGEPVILREGRLATAVRASCSVPGIVTPTRMTGRLLCDGGISDNVPVDAARALGADYVIGVDLFAPEYDGRWGPLGIGFSAIENLVRRAGSGVCDADSLIVPQIQDHSYLRFSKCQDYIALGEAAARKVLPQIERALA